MKIAVTGASGLIGSALLPVLRADGHEVTKLVRRTPGAPDEARWDPALGTVDTAALVGTDAVIHLAGVGIGDRRWTDDYQHKILDSRVDGTTTISRTVAALDPRPQVLLSASAVGFYGDTGDRPIDESAPVGAGFLADVVRQWEAATAPARDAGIRVVNLRTGIVLSAAGGLLGRTLPLFKAGLGGRLGSGRQYVSWISMADEVAAIRFLLTAQDVQGPVNLAGPAPVTNADFTDSLGRAVHRPTITVAPAFALRLGVGRFADEGILIGQRVLPKALEAADFSFQHSDLDTALQAALSAA
ncbi:MAG: TIGR01777 family oxidoreductase [Actinomycetota bacterium]|nr:TIGR01777 family oxidoreductase [Actinomycetota bacterium]